MSRRSELTDPMWAELYGMEKLTSSRAAAQFIRRSVDDAAREAELSKGPWGGEDPVLLEPILKPPKSLPSVEKMLTEIAEDRLSMAAVLEASIVNEWLRIQAVKRGVSYRSITSTQLTEWYYGDRDRCPDDYDEGDCMEGGVR